MKGPKITVIGAGSYFFGKPVIWNMVKSEYLREGTLALVDTNPEALETMMKLAGKAVEASKAPVKITGSTNRKEVLRDSDFVVLTFSRDNAFLRGMDTRVASRHGVTMCSSDTIGPGGIFRAMREIPEILSICSDVKQLCPDAWVINFINPTAVIGIAMMRYAPDIKSFALCDGNHLPYSRKHYMKTAGVIESEEEEISPEKDSLFNIKIAGVNHCTWITECTYNGKDLLYKFRDAMVKALNDEWREGPSCKSKPRLNPGYAIELFDIYNAYPTAVSHTKEYVPFFQGYGISQAKPEPIIPFDANNRALEMKSAWNETVELAEGKRPIEEFLNINHGDHATDIIESMWGNLEKTFFINGPNQQAVTNMPDDAFLELERNIDMNRFSAKAFGKMPRGLLGLQMQILDTHELTAEAAVSHNKQILKRAMLTDPIINNIGDAERIVEELLESEKEYLPEEWYR